MGLYRGLKLKTHGTQWDVEVLTSSADQLLKMGTTPMILSVGLPARESQEMHNMMTEWGWQPGVGHSVVLMPNGPRLIVADPTPAVVKERWSRADLRHLYRGTAMRLVKRP
jgi:hypothetical protein